jgi:uncharacterized membrane protein
MSTTQSANRPVQTATAAGAGWWWVVPAGGVLGVITTVWQTVERIETLGAADNASPLCEINAVVSCGAVFDEWQSSALGIPNFLVGLPVFALMASAALGALLGSRPSRRYVAVLWGIALFMTAFVVWYMQQSAFVMGALCVFCTASMVSIMVIGAGLTRVADATGVLGSARTGQVLARLVESSSDLVLWAGLLVAVAVMLWLGLGW